jgi:hypothetical protein
MLLVRMGLPGAADDLARAAYKSVRSLHISLPSLADECPEWVREELNQLYPGSLLGCVGLHC